MTAALFGDGVFVLDADHDPIDVLTDVTSLVSVDRATRGGTWQMNTTVNPQSLTLRDAPGAEIVFAVDGVQYGGPVTSWHETYDSSGGRLQFNGINHLGRLAWRNTDPEPGTASPPFSTSAYSTYTGDVATVIADMVDDRCGAAALVARQFLTVTAPTPAGPTVTVNLRFKKTLEEVVTELAVAHDMVPAVTLTPAGLVFTVAPAVVRADAPLGPDIGGVDGWEGGKKAPEATQITAGGQGTLTGRTFSQRSLAADPRWPWLIESWEEHTEATNQTELDDATDRDLKAAAGELSFTVDAAAYQSDTVRFGRDFFLGDIVPLRLGGTETLTQITEVETSIGPDGVDRTLTVGVPAVAGVAALIAHSRKADRRVRSLQGA